MNRECSSGASYLNYKQYNTYCLADIAKEAETAEGEALDKLVEEAKELKAKQAELDSAYYSGTTKGQQEQAKHSTRCVMG